MNIETLKTDLRRAEGEASKPYRDGVGKLTIGVGRNLDDIGISSAEAGVLLDNDVGRAVAGLDRALPWGRGLTEARQRALAEMAFNLGLPRLLGFQGMLAALEAGDHAAAAAEALDSRWAGQVGARARRIAAMIREG